MHIPKQFNQTNQDKLLGLIRDYPFATLITNSESGLSADHLPVVLNSVAGKTVIQAHTAKANQLWKSLAEGAQALLVFNGPHCYVSPNYYATKQESGRVVPTWNYVVVHVRGTLSFIHEKRWLLDLMHKLTTQNEAHQQQPWSVSDAPPDYVGKMLPAIVGIEVAIASIEGQWKLSQNQPPANKASVAQALGQTGDANDAAIAELVKSAT